MVLRIDAICINQGNIMERNDQVRQMGSIYKQASGVVVWLGRDSGNAQLAMDFVRDAISQENRFEWVLSTLSNPEYSGRWAAFMDVFDHRDYWRRSWVVQEYALASDVIFRCGWPDILNDHIHEFMVLFWDDQRGLSEIPADHSNTLYQFLQGSFVDMLYIREHRQIPGQRLGFCALLVLNAGREASGPRDKVYGVLGLADDLDDTEIVPNYSLPVRKLYEDVARLHIVKSKNLNIICARQNCSANRTLVLDPGLECEYEENPSGLANRKLSRDPIPCRGSSTAEFKFERNGSILEVSGLCVGIVSGVGEVCLTDEQDPDLQAHIVKWLDLANISRDASKPNSINETSRVDCFWRTTTKNRTKNGFMAPISFGDMFDVWSGRRKAPPAPELSTLSYYVTMRAAIRDRRFFLSESSTMGLGPSGLMRDDMICVLLGCDAPTAIRREGDHHVFVGENLFPRLHGWRSYKATKRR
jgi:hypothetical protein